MINSAVLQLYHDIANDCIDLMFNDKFSSIAAIP